MGSSNAAFAGWRFAATALCLTAAIALGGVLRAEAAETDGERGATVVAEEEQAAQERLGPTRAAERERLFKALKASRRELDARETADKIWRFWFIAPNAEADAAMNGAQQRLRVADYERAVAELTALVEREPEWSEAWNQRAYAYFLKGEYDRSLDDVTRVLELEPRHFGALSGQALILIQQGRVGLAVPALERALELHPFLKERYLLQQLTPKQTPL